MNQITLEQGQITAMINYLQAYAQMMVSDMNKCELYAQILPPEYRKDMRNKADTLLEHLGYFAELIEQLETARGDTPQSDMPSLEFIQAMDKYHDIIATYGEDSEQAFKQMAIVMSHTPQSAMDEIHAKAKELDLLPKVNAYTDDGKPLYGIKDIAQHFGVSEQEVLDKMHLLEPDEIEYHGNVNLIQ